MFAQEQSFLCGGFTKLDSSHEKVKQSGAQSTQRSNCRSESEDVVFESNRVKVLDTKCR